MTYAGNLDPDSYLGFMAKIEDYDYKLIALKADAGVRHAQSVPTKPCEFDDGRSVCSGRLGDAPDLYRRSERQAEVLVAKDRGRRGRADDRGDCY
jgi:hypothetical protein